MSTWPHGGLRQLLWRHTSGAGSPRTSVEFLYEADSLYEVERWLRKNGLYARVWRVPATPEEAGSMLSTHDLSVRRAAAGFRRLAASGAGCHRGNMAEVLMPCVVDSGAMNTLLLD
jgi:hypothetical protein